MVAVHIEARKMTDYVSLQDFSQALESFTQTKEAAGLMPIGIHRTKHFRHRGFAYWVN
jgi:hypothetical protein